MGHFPKIKSSTRRNKHTTCRINGCKYECCKYEDILVKKEFGNYHMKALKWTDSRVALHWIASKQTTLKMWVHHSIVEINMICDASLWGYVQISNMVADLGARKRGKISDVMEGSNWINKLKWMSKPEEDLPIFL